MTKTTILKTVSSMILILTGQSSAQLIIHPAIELEIQTEAGICYQIQESGDMSTWTDTDIPFAGTGVPTFRFFPTRGDGKQFYRVETSGAGGCVTIDVPSYANLCGRWNYRRTDGDTGGYTPWAAKIMGTRTENGEPVYMLQEFDVNDNPNDQFYFRTDMSTGLFETGILNDYGQPSEKKAFWQPAVPRLMGSFVPGKEYLTQHTRPDIPLGTLTGHTTMQFETITVPYGTVECLKVSQFFSIGNETGGEETRWYAKHLGLVKRTQGDNGDVWELISWQP